MTDLMKTRGWALLSLSQVRKGLICALLKPLRARFHHTDDGSYPSFRVRTDIKKPPVEDKTKVYDACWQTMRRTEYKCRSDVELDIAASISDRKKCREDPCFDSVQAWDLTHYKPQDMIKRKYPRTWKECVVKSRKRKMKCVPLPLNPPRRVRKAAAGPRCPVNLCVLGKVDLELGPCELMKPTLCPRYKMPNCCVEPRNPPVCKRPFRAGLCKRRRTKYPSFSECIYDALPVAPPVECNCLLRPALCDVWKYYRKRFY